MKINDYCHWGKRAQKTKLTVMHFSVFAAWPRGIHCIPPDRVHQFEGRLHANSASSSKG